MVREDSGAIAEELYHKGIKIIAGKAYYNDRLLDYEDYKALGSKETIKYLEDISRYNAPKERDIYEAVMALPVQSYYGRLYRDNIPLHEIEAYELVREMNPTFDCAQIQQVLKYANIMKRTQIIP